MRTFTLQSVALAWSGVPFESPAVGWLAEDGSTTKWAPGAKQPSEDAKPPVSFMFRLEPTMADHLRIETRLDEVNGGIDSTVDLDLAIQQRYEALRAKFEAALWPDGRPSTTDPDVLREQERQMDLLYYGPDNLQMRLILDRLTAIRDRQRMAAEWAVLVLGPPPGWEDIASRPLRPGVAEAIARAYMAAKAKGLQDLGK